MTGIQGPLTSEALLGAARPGDRERLSALLEGVADGCSGAFVAGGAGTEVHWRAAASELDTSSVAGARTISFLDVLAEIERGRALADAELRYHRLVDVSNVIVIEIGIDAKITFVSRAVERILGYEPGELIGRSAFDLIPSDGMEEARARFSRSMDGQEIEPRDAEIRGKSGEIRIIRVTPRLVTDADGNPAGISSVGIDVTNEVRAQRELQASEERYRRLVESPDVISFEFDLDGATTFVSPAVEPILGYSPDELVGSHAFAIVADATLPTAEKRLELARAGEEIRPFAAVATRKDGSTATLHASWRLVRDGDGNPTRVIGTAVDMTERLAALEELERSLTALREADGERRQLLGRLIAAQDSERARLATDLHDRTIQTLSAMLLRVGLLLDEVDADEAVRAELLQIDEVVRDAIKELRDLVFELRPPTLEDAGLAAALRELLDQVHAETGTSIELSAMSGLPKDSSARNDAYRIAREAIGNAARHSGADRIEVAITLEEGELRVRVTDDDCGFDPDAAPKAGHIGLQSMRERAEAAGGWWLLDTVPSRGTEVSFGIPMRRGLG